MTKNILLRILFSIWYWIEDRVEDVRDMLFRLSWTDGRSDDEPGS